MQQPPRHGRVHGPRGHPGTEIRHGSGLVVFWCPWLRLTDWQSSIPRSKPRKDTGENLQAETRHALFSRSGRQGSPYSSPAKGAPQAPGFKHAERPSNDKEASLFPQDRLEETREEGDRGPDSAS